MLKGPRNASDKKPGAKMPGNLKLVRRLLAEQGKKYWKRYALAFVMMGGVASCTAALAYLIGNVINEAYVYKDLAALTTLCLITMGLFAIKGLSSYGQSVVLSRIGNQIVAENQRRMFDKMLQESASFFADRHSSEFMARVAYGTNAIAGCLNLVITALGRDALTLIGLAVVMVVQDPLLSLAGIVIAPPAILVLRKLVKRVSWVARTQFNDSVRILRILQETVQGFRTIKAFGLEREMRDRIYGAVANVERAANTLARVSNRTSPLMETLGGFAIALVFMYGGYRVLLANASPGEFVSFITAFLLAYEPAKRVARLNVDLSTQAVGVRIFYEFIDLPCTEPNDSHKPALEVAGGEIKFDKVDFAYRPGEPVLRSLSLIAEAGRVTALVGPSGGGKTTILNLLLRLYDRQGGLIAVDGQDTLACSRDSVRQHIAYVGQDIFLFDGTISDNIALGRRGATEEQIEAAARAAFAHDFIMSFPKGYKTPVGENGIQLSGGQRQRIALARALVRDAPIVLLDEPTASLDSESEQFVQTAISRLCKGRTTIVIAHRLNTIMHADKIHVIEGGRVVESGHHEQLLRANRRYADFFRLQLINSPSSADDRTVTPAA